MVNGGGLGSFSSFSSLPHPGREDQQHNGDMVNNCFMVFSLILKPHVAKQISSPLTFRYAQADPHVEAVRLLSLQLSPAQNDARARVNAPASPVAASRAPRRGQCAGTSS